MLRIIYFSALIISLTTVCNAQVPSDSLIGYWPFNGDASDVSSKNNHGINHGGPGFSTDRFGYPNSALFLDGIDDYITIPHNADLNFDGFTDSYTISVWVKSADPSGGDQGSYKVITKWDENQHTTPYPINMRCNATQLLAGIADVTTSSAVTLIYGVSGEMWDDDWHHVVFSVNHDTDSLYAYLDGNLVDRELNTVPNSTANEVDIYLGYAPNLETFYSGHIDDLTIYDRAVSDSEVVVLYNDTSNYTRVYDIIYDTIPILNGYVISCDSLLNALQENIIANFQFDGSIMDYSSYNHSAVLNGGEYCTDRFGREGHALNLDGVDDYFTIFHNNVLNLDGYTDSYTLNIWVKTDDPGNPRLIQKWDGITSTGYPFAFQTAITGCSVAVYDGILGNYTNTRWDGSDIWDDAWHMLTLVVDQTKDTVEIFLDGYTYSSALLLAEGTTENNADIQTGAPYSGKYFEGSIDNLTIFDVALSAYDIMELYKSPMCTMVLFDSTLVLPYTPVWDTLIYWDTITIKDTVVVHDTIFDIRHYVIGCDSNINALDSCLIANFQFEGNMGDYSIYRNKADIYGGEFGTDRFGRENHALYLDGVDDYIIIYHNNYLNLDGYTDSYTLNIWIKSDDPNSGRLISKWNEILGIPFPFSFQYNENGCSPAIGDGVKENATYLNFGSDIWDNNWHLLTMAVDQVKDSMLLYLDGTYFNGVEILAENPARNTNDIYISSPILNKWYKGYVDDLTIFNKALTEDEIFRIYTSPMCSPVLYDPGLIPPWQPVWDTLLLPVKGILYDTISVTDTLVIDLNLDIHTDPVNAKINVYPNPTRDILHISVLNHEVINNYQLRIINMSGSTIFETLVKQNSFTMELSTITEAGIYNLILMDGEFNTVAVRKIVIQ